MKIKMLKSLLDQYPEEAYIKILDNITYSYSDIQAVSIEYVVEDNYSMPVITLKVNV